MIAKKNKHRQRSIKGSTISLNPFPNDAASIFFVLKFGRVIHDERVSQGGQTINDRLTAAKFSLAGSQLGKSVCKATTEEPIGPKKKHLDYLLHCTHEPNVSIPQLANLLIERTQMTNWAVVYKALVTIHNLMCYGNERFTQYLASCNANLNLGNFLDKSNVQGYDMSTHVRRYAKYIGEKVYTYRLCAFDFCKVKRGREDGLLRTMHTEKLLKTLPILQGQVDTLLEFQVTPAELSNGIINSCFILMFRDLIRLFACYNDGIINLLEKYFDMNKKQCREALDMYKKFLLRMDKVAEFLKVAESVGIDKGEIPDLAKAPNSLLEALEQHLNSLEGKGSHAGSRVTSPTGPGPSSVTQSAIHQLSSMTDRALVDANSLDESTKQKYLREEQERLELLKQQRLREREFGHPGEEGSANNPFLATSTSGDLIGSLDQPAYSQNAQSKASDDLLSLDTNPFAATIQNAYQQPAHDPTNPFGAPTQSYGSGVSPIGGTNAFQPNFESAFGSQQNNQSDIGNIFKPAFGMLDESVQLPRAPSGADISQERAQQTNPFLDEVLNDSDTADDAWAAASSVKTPAVSDVTWQPTEGTLVHGLGMEGTEGGRSDQLAEAQFAVDAEIKNPFSAFAQNAEALTSAGGSTQPQNLFAGGMAPPVPSPSPLPSPSPFPGGMDTAQMGQPPFGMESGMGPGFRQSTSPMAIPGGQQQLGVYDQTPFTGMDASYTASPQFPRHMMAPSPQAQMASSYTGGGMMGAFPGGVPQRPPSAPATDLAGLDPLGDLLTPATTGGQQQPRSKQQAGKVLTGNLDESLASLAMNLTIDKGQPGSKPVAWTGGQQRAVRPAGMAPMQQGYGMPYQQQQPGWGGGHMMPGGVMPVQQPGYGQQPMMTGGMRPMQPGVGVQHTQSTQQDPFGGL